MKSAFGIDHGEFSKAIPGMSVFSRIGSGAGKKLSSGGSKLETRATNNFKSVARMHRGSASYGPAMKGAKAAVKPQLGVARGMQRAGAAMQRRPGLTGGAAVGGGAGAVGVGMSTRKKQY